MTSRFDLGLLMTLLESDEVVMRYQDPKLEVHGSKKKVWRIRPYIPVVTPEGKVERRRVPIVLGFCSEMSRDKAKAAKVEALATVNAGRAVISSQITFKHLIKRFREVRVPQLSVSTQGKYTSHLIRIETAFGDLKAGEIDRSVVEAWLASLELAALTKADCRNVLSATFEAAREWRLFDGVNPARGARLGRVKEGREKRLVTVTQYLAYLDALPETAVAPVAHARAMVETAAVAGLRISEVLGLQRRDLDAREKTITIRRRYFRGDVDIPKSAKSRRVIYVGEVVDVLLGICQGAADDAFVFAQADGTIPDDRALQSYVFRPAAEAIGIYYKGFGMHAFRRASITWRQELGAHPIEAMRAAGHARPSTTELYTLTDRTREREIADKLIARVAPPAGKPQ